MNREYHKWHSGRLHRDMELLMFGHAGVPMLVFPTSMGTFYEYETRGMIGAIANKYEQGELQAFCVDSVDSESWYNRHIHPRDRVLRHMQYENYILEEVVPLMRSRGSSDRIAVTGCSFGGYHAMNIALRHPDVFTDCITMGGAFDIHQFLGGYYDENCYFNCPPDYLEKTSNGWYLDQYRAGRRYVLATGDHDMCLGENYRLAGIMGSKGIPHWLDVWGDNTGHDWPWWQRMAMKYF
ncbi:MAG: alpha/beta hydrolase-fold protein [Acidobacteriota bacterium]|nr:alpha/beta hydrolase-fold protein [Acidobacteriota bacterium]